MSNRFPSLPPEVYWDMKGPLFRRALWRLWEPGIDWRAAYDRRSQPVTGSLNLEHVLAYRHVFSDPDSLSAREGTIRGSDQHCDTESYALCTFESGLQTILPTGLILP